MLESEKLAAKKTANMASNSENSQQSYKNSGESHETRQQSEITCEKPRNPYTNREYLSKTMKMAYVNKTMKIYKYRDIHGKLQNFMAN